MTITEYLLPGERVMPEGIVVGPDNDFFAGSSADGTIYRGRLNEQVAKVWQEPDEDGRTSVLGMAVYQGERLIVCGGKTGHLFVYDIASEMLVSRATVAGFLNDVCIVGDHAYATDSSRPVVWRFDLMGGADEVPVDGAGEDAYLNGIVATPDGSLLAAAQGTEMLWRIDLETGKAEKLADRFAADGLLLIGDVLYGLCNEGTTMEDAVFFLAGLRIDDARSVTPLGRFTDPRFDTPTTLDTDGGRLLI